MIAIVRIRGTVGVRGKIEDALRMLRLDSLNKCVVVPENPSYRGMIQKVKDHIAFGEISQEMFTDMLKKRGRLEGDRRLDDKTIKETGYDSIDKLAKDIFEGKVAMKDVKKLKPVFRLTPPSKGFVSTSMQYPKGDIGNHKKEIDSLIKRMI